MMRAFKIDLGYFFSYVAGCENFNKVLQIFTMCRDELGEILSACEFLDSECMRLVETHLNLTNPLSGNS